MADRPREPAGDDALPREACLRHLAQARCGRLQPAPGMGGISLDYLLDETTVVFRVDQGELPDADPWRRAAFEVAGTDPATSGTWTVVVTGHLESVSPAAASTFERLHCLRSGPWGGGPRPRWLRLSPTRIAGSRT